MALAMLVLTSGCMTGHLVDAVRRHEEVLYYRTAAVDGDRLVLGYTAVVSDDAGMPRGYVERRAAVPVEVLRASSSPAVDTVPVARLDLRSSESAGRPVVVWVVETDEDAAAAPVGVLLVRREGGHDVAVELRDAALPEATTPLYSGVFARSETPAWVWALVPVTLVGDAVGTPVLAFFAPAFLATGD